MSTDPRDVLFEGIQDLVQERAIDIAWSELEFRNPDALQIDISKGFFLTQVRMNTGETTFRWRDDTTNDWQEENADFMPTLVERIRARVAALY